MKKKKVILADLDEMVFENRERTYGAYPLRKNYPWHLITSLTVVMHIFLVGVTYPIWSTHLNERGIYLENIKPLFSPFPYLVNNTSGLSHEKENTAPTAAGVCILVDPGTTLKTLPSTETYSRLNFFRDRKYRCSQKKVEKR
ncbi:MAG: hypothetical protein AAF655_22015 [Bacteroidota bacterium]